MSSGAENGGGTTRFSRAGSQTCTICTTNVQVRHVDDVPASPLKRSSLRSGGCCYAAEFMLRCINSGRSSDEVELRNMLRCINSGRRSDEVELMKYAPVHKFREMLRRSGAKKYAPVHKFREMLRRSGANEICSGAKFLVV